MIVFDQIRFNQSQELEFESVFVVGVPPCHAALLMKSLSLLPETPLAHLKRIRKLKSNHPSDVKLQALLFKCKDVDLPFIQSWIKPIHATSHEWPIEIVSVPKYPPLTREQWEEWKQVWPMSFHSQAHPEEDALEESELQRAIEWIDVLRVRVSQSQDPKSSLNMAIVVDPKTNTQMAFASDARLVHPLHHAIMQAVESVAEQERNHRKSKKRDRSDALGYLCTGLDLCSMALVHSRIRRVYFIHSNSVNGGFTGPYHIHAHKNLNHRFRVYKWSEYVDPQQS